MDNQVKLSYTSMAAFFSTLAQRKRNSKNVPFQKRFEGYNTYHKKEWKNPLGKPTNGIPYVLTTPLFDKTKLISLIKAKSRNELMVSLLHQTHGVDETYIIKLDKSERVWIPECILYLLVSGIYPIEFSRWAMYASNNNLDSGIQQFKNDKFFYNWDETRTNDELLSDTTLAQGTFVYSKDALSIGQLSEHFSKEIPEMLNMLKKFGLVMQYVDKDKKVTLWNPEFTAAHRGMIGTFTPKGKDNGKFYNIYTNKNFLNELETIIFNK